MIDRHYGHLVLGAEDSARKRLDEWAKKRREPPPPRPEMAAESLCLTRADDEARTRDPQLGKLMLYQLSYVRNRLGCYQSVAVVVRRSRRRCCSRHAAIGKSSGRIYFAYTNVVRPISVPRTSWGVRMLEAGHTYQV